jgi:dCTP deaminase
MLASDTIVKAMEQQSIQIDDFNTDQLNPNSYNLRLGPVIKVYEKMHSLHAFWEKALSSYEFIHKHHGESVAEETRRDMTPPAPPLVPLDMRADEPTVEMTIPETGFVLWPGVLYLGHTLEYTETHQTVPLIEGRSGVGRLGIIVHVTAGFGDIGFCGDWTLEITVDYPVRVYAGVQICQICYSEAVGNAKPYRGQYQGQRGPKASGIWRDFERGRVLPYAEVMERWCKSLALTPA